VQVVLIVVAAAIVVGVVVVALGRGGEMAQVTADFAPGDLDDIDEVTATDVALLRLPRALWGYHAQATDHALGLIAQTMSDRDVEIATLQRQLADAHSAEGAAQQEEMTQQEQFPLQEQFPAQEQFPLQEQFPAQEQFPLPQQPLPPPVADVTGAPGAAATSPPLPSRPSVRRREMADQQPDTGQPSADQWPVQAPWSAWERRSAPSVPDATVPDAGVPDAGVPDAGVPDAGVPDSDPAVPPDDW
jgi:hypothetical protein